MNNQDFEIVTYKIDEMKDFLNNVSQDIWKMPELGFKEVQAHATLTCALKRSGFQVQKHYFMPTAFRSEFSSSKAGGPTVAVLLEYDALPDIGHGCGHNLIAEAGLAASIAIKTVMESDPTLSGKLVVLGTPAEEGGGGKIRLLELGAFDDVDVALMVHPGTANIFRPFTLCITRYNLDFKGQAAHAAVYPWNGKNALDAAVACYQSLALLKQHIKPTCRLQAIITKGGVAANIIPDDTSMEVHVRAPSKRELLKLKARVEACFTSAAEATGCEVHFRCDKENTYENVITNQVLGNLFEDYMKRLGLTLDMSAYKNTPIGSSDMGNVSHLVPAIHPIYQIPTTGSVHSKDFTIASGLPTAQEPTLLVSKAVALTAIHVMRSQDTLQEVKRFFQADIKEDMDCR